MITTLHRIEKAAAVLRFVTDAVSVRVQLYCMRGDIGAQKQLQRTHTWSFCVCVWMHYVTPRRRSVPRLCHVRALWPRMCHALGSLQHRQHIGNPQHHRQPSLDKYLNLQLLCWRLQNRSRRRSSHRHQHHQVQHHHPLESPVPFPTRSAMTTRRVSSPQAMGPPFRQHQV